MKTQHYHNFKKKKKKKKVTALAACTCMYAGFRWIHMSKKNFEQKKTNTVIPLLLKIPKK